jgi:uncharacterized protein (TIGR02594 family)
MFTVTVTPDSLHTRQGPGTAFDSIGFVKQSDRFTALAIDSTGTWLQVQQSSDKGLLGWCSARYLLPATVNAPWLDAAVKEIGIKEYPGKSLKPQDKQNHPRIQLYLSTVNNLSDIEKLLDETPWCSCFINWCVEQCNGVGTDSAWAKSWGNWRSSVPLANAKTGDILVFDRKSATGGGGHVGIFIAFDASKENVLVIGGNQSNAVRYAWYPVNGVQSGTHYKLLSARRSGK